MALQASGITLAAGACACERQGRRHRENHDVGLGRRRRVRLVEPFDDLGREIERGMLPNQHRVGPVEEQQKLPLREHLLDDS